MTITTTELFLFGWAMVATLMWVQTRANLNFHKMMTIKLLYKIGQGKAKVEKDGDGFMIKEV